MLTYIRNFFIGKPTRCKGVLIGLDAAGKSTFLYKLRYGKIDTIIPAIGFNVETLESPWWEFHSWDVGGCDKIRPQLNIWYAKGTFLLFMHDSHDIDRLEESLSELQNGIEPFIKHGGTHVFIMLNKQDILPESERDERVAFLRSKFEELTKAYRDKLTIEILDLPRLSVKTGQNLEEVLRRIRKMVLGKEEMESKQHVDRLTDTPPLPTEEQLIERIRHSSAAANSPDRFWQDFQDARLSLWDHYTHLRAGYFVLIENLSGGESESILEVGEDFIEHLERLRAMNPDKFRNTTHRTMTIFWLIHLHAAALKYMDSVNDVEKNQYPQRDKFEEVLLCSPKLMNSGLWREYYSKETLFSADAKLNWRLPDLKPLPAVPGQIWKEEISNKMWN